MDDVELRRFTDNYWAWQGLKWAPFGPVLMWAGVSLLGQRWLGDTAANGVTVILLAGALATVRPVQRYYDAMFGVVEQVPDAHRRRERLKWLAAYPLLLVVPFVEILLQPRLSPTAVTLAGVIVAFWWSTGRGRPHYVVAAAVMAALVALPATGFTAPGRPVVGTLVIGVGVLYVVGGILDHRELTRRLGPLLVESVAPPTADAG